MVVPAYTIILNHLEKLASPSDLSSVYTESSSLQDAAKAAFVKLNKYYNISSELCTIATVLDPRLKLNFYKADVGTSAEDPKEILSYERVFTTEIMEFMKLLLKIHPQERLSISFNQFTRHPKLLLTALSLTSTCLRLWLINIQISKCWITGKSILTDFQTYLEWLEITWQFRELLLHQKGHLVEVDN